MNTKSARISIHRDKALSILDRRLFGSFLEHLGRAVYEGVWQPGSPLSDDEGFRADLLEEVRSLGVPIVRYPGGNFVSGYNWLDGVGPTEQRPSVHEKAWNSTETNQFGTNEFMRWCRLTGTEPLLVFNLGDSTPEMAAAYVDYCNGRGGTQWSDLRRSHGVEQPHGVRRWCLGNEIDGPWEIGHKKSREYARIANDTARCVREVDPNVQLIAAGSSNTELPTYGHWDRDVVEACYEHIDAISLHNYYGNTEELTGNSTARYLAMNLDMERQIREIAAICDDVRQKLGARKRLWLSFDEWNVWYRARTAADQDGQGKVAPHLLEEEYNLEDALLVGGFFNTLMRESARVRIACQAQLVNVIAPLLTSNEGVLRQSIYYPYAWALKHANGKVLDCHCESETYPIEAGDLRHDFARDAQVPFIDASVTLDESTGKACLFLLNRDLDERCELALDWHGTEPVRVLACETLAGTDLKAVNSFRDRNKVAPRTLDAPRPGRNMTLELPATSYTILSLALN